MGTKITNINGNNICLEDVDLYSANRLTTTYLYCSDSTVLPTDYCIHNIRLYKSGVITAFIQIFASSSSAITTYNNLAKLIATTSEDTSGYSIYVRAFGTYFVSSSVGWRPIKSISRLSSSGSTSTDYGFTIYYSSSRTSNATSSITMYSSTGLTISDNVVALQ